METFDEIRAAPAIEYMPGERPLTPADNNAQYVDNLISDLAHCLRDTISYVKADLLVDFPPDQEDRLQRLLQILRTTWDGIAEIE